MSPIERTAWGISPALLQVGIALCLIHAAHAAPADASKNANTLEEVVVTATKRSERLQDVPLSVSVLSADDIQLRGFTQFTDYLNSLPGVYLQETGPGTSTIHIRGATESGVGSTVSTYFGESITSVFSNHGGKPNLRLVDIDRVEVLRGPQGTLFGANSLAGVLRILPARPDLTDFAANVGTRGFATAHSSDVSYHAEGVVNIPLIQDRLALRLIGYKDEIAGYIDNIVPAQPSVDYGDIFGLPAGTLVTPGIAAFTRKDINKEETWGTRAALRWQPTDQLHFDLTYMLQDVQLKSEPHTDPAAGRFAQNRAMDVYRRGGYGERVDVSSFEATYEWEQVSLVSISNWMEMDRSSDQDITFLASLSFGVPIPWELRDTSLGRIFTQEVRLQSRGEHALQWTLGAFYLHQDADLSQFVPDYSCPNCLPTVLLGQDFALDAPRQKFFDEKQRSVFGEVSYEFLPRWTVGVGGRFLDQDLENGDISGDGLLLGGPVTAGPPNEGSNSEFNPSGYLRFKPTNETTLYLQAARGFRGSEVNGVLPDECADDAAQVGLGAITDPDTLWNYEIGMKSRFADGRLGVNAAVYKSKWEGVQLLLGLNCGFSGIVNAGDIDGKGVELELLAQPTASWRFNLAFGYNKNEFDSVIEGTGFVKGERLPDAAEKNGSLGAQYNFGLNAAWSGFARADVVYVGDVLSKFASVVVVPSFTEANLRLGFQRDTLAVELYGQNIADKRGITVAGNPDFGGYQTLIRPRELGVELRYAF